MDQPLLGKTIAILVANGFEETEMTEPQRALLKSGAKLKVISPEQGLVNGWHGKAWGHYFPVDEQITDVLAADYDMLILPGGERSVAKLKQNAHTRRIVGSFLDGGKPIAAIDDGIDLLVFVDKIKGRTIAAPENLHGAVETAGGQVVEEPVAVDKNLITGYDQDNLPAFVEQVVKSFLEAVSVKKAA